MENEKIACYTFLPWSRRGIGSRIKEKENFGSEGANANTDRASIDIKVNIERTALSGETDQDDILKKVKLFGPGDIIGIDKKSIIRVEPKEGVNNFEFNYLPYVEFYEEDFPWRYTPASVNDPNATDPNIDKRLRPWLTLLVFEESEFSFEKFIPDATPLPFITLNEDNLFPVDDQYWAWAHVHVNQNLDNESGDSVSNKLDKLVKSQPNYACSRLLCPRKLRPNTKYHAFLVPAYEKGRLAGLGDSNENIDAAGSQQYSTKNAGTQLPYYHNWSFSTGSEGDFEELVQRIEARPVDERVGRRLMDIQSPGYGLEYKGDAEISPKDQDPENQKGAIFLEGALRPPEVTTQNFANSNEPEAENMVTRLEALLNLDTVLKMGEDLTGQAFEKNPFSVLEGAPKSIQDDPIITPPIYGRWHNLKNKVDKSKGKHWINHLNLDPRQRSVAGFGTKVIQKNQESYMDRAWGQFESLLEVNHKLKQAQFVQRFSANLFKKKISKISDESLLIGTAKLHTRILSDQETLGKKIRNSRLSNALLKSEFRKITRPSGPITSFSKKSKLLNTELVIGSNDGTKVAAERYDHIDVASDGTVTQLRNALGSVITNPSIPTAPGTNVIIENTGSSTGNSRFTAPTTGNITLPGIRPNSEAFAGQPLEVKPTNINLTPGIEVDFQNENIVIRYQGDSTLKGNLQSLTENEFMASQVIMTKYLQTVNWSLLTPGESLKINKIVGRIKSQLDPEEVFTKRIFNRIALGENIPKPNKQKLEPIYIAPQFDDAMYRPLVDISSEFLVPNLDLIKNNSISILETNQEFIESYMVGLNHEFSRELLWREYLTDQRGSYFRQFWDVSSNENKSNLSDSDFRESLKDIDPIHLWKNKKLGDNRPDTQVITDRMVLVIRGDLLRKYPNTIIYLHEAEFDNVTNPNISVPRHMKDGGEKLYPVFEARIDPDIYFFGFNIEVNKAKGNLENLESGYFIVLKERTGEIHFGMDIDNPESKPKLNQSKGDIILTNNVKAYASLLFQLPVITNANGQEGRSSWNDLSWKELPSNLTYIDLDHVPESPGREGVNWGANAADMAYILYQNPYMMAIHASRMISDEGINS